jgi:hypothetical protein
MYWFNSLRNSAQEIKVSLNISCGKVPIIQQKKIIVLEPFYCVIEDIKHMSKTLLNNIFFSVCLKLLDNKEYINNDKKQSLLNIHFKGAKLLIIKE